MQDVIEDIELELVQQENTANIKPSM